MPLVSYSERVPQELKPAKTRPAPLNRVMLGPAVRAIRDSLGIAHGEFAARCGISPGYLTKIEQGVQQPSAPVATTIAQQLGVRLDAITYACTCGSRASA